MVQNIDGANGLVLEYLFGKTLALIQLQYSLLHLFLYYFLISDAHMLHRQVIIHTCFTAMLFIG